MVNAHQRFHVIVYRWLRFVAYLLGQDSLFDYEFKITAYTVFALVINLSVSVSIMCGMCKADSNKDTLLKVWQ